MSKLKTKRKRVSQRPECWGCGQRAAYCGGKVSLKTQGWYCEPMPHEPVVKETYCDTCIFYYGTPEEWAPETVLDER